MSGPGGAAEFFEELRREYLSEASVRLSELRKDVAAIRAGEPDAANSLKVRLHRLAGSGGSYGFPAISASSRAAEQWIGANPGSGPTAADHLEQAMAKIAQAFDAAAAELGLPSAPARPAAFGWRALILGAPGEVTDRVAVALADAGYAVTRQLPPADPEQIPVSLRPDVAVIVATDPSAAESTVAQWTANRPCRPGAVFLAQTGFEVDPLVAPFANLDGVVSGDRIETTLEAAVRTLGRTATAPRSALIVDREDQGPIRTLTTGLEGVAVQVTQVRGGLPARDVLGTGRPDVIVLDGRLIDTPVLALVRWIRQQPAHRVTPIVVLAATVDDADRLEAIRAGADDMVVKTTPAPQLVQLILARIDRSRAVRAVAHRDELTGLLNHDAMVEELDRAIGVARRSNEPSALLVVDLDHFRRINEQQGQAVGDHVLVHVARLIAGSVRSSDLVARMGGEEFGVLVRRCQLTDAAQVAEKVRATVSAVPARIGTTAIGVRVSVGVASCGDRDGTSADVLRAATKSLTAAKESGRDRVGDPGTG